MSIFFIDFFKIYKYDKKIRLGINKDGGYVIAYDLPKIGDTDYDCYISAGVSTEESFTRDFLNKYKINKERCYAFDGTIDKYPTEYGNQITFIKKNIDNTNNDATTNMRDIINKCDNIFLKMDIEGCEYKWLKEITTDELKKFKQIVIEFHGILDDSWWCNHDDKIRCWIKLFKTHYLVHAHGNNEGTQVNGMPNTIELTYINKNLFVRTDVDGIHYDILPVNTEKMQIGLDRQNNPNKEEINMNHYPFVYYLDFFVTKYSSENWCRFKNLNTK